MIMLFLLAKADAVVLFVYVRITCFR